MVGIAGNNYSMAIKPNSIQRVLYKIDRDVLRILGFWPYFYCQRTLGFPIVKLEFYKKVRYWPNLKNPKSFNEKVTHKKLYGRNPLLPIIADKYRVREYVRSLIGEEYLIPLLQVLETPEEINFELLPDEFIIKTNFSSGLNILIENKHEVRQKKIKAQLSHWMDMKYGYRNLVWFAQEIPRKILIERLLRNSNGDIPCDYKFFVFHGEVEFIQVDFDRFTKHSRMLYDKEWKKLNFTIRNDLQNTEGVAKPNNLQIMLEIAKELAKNFSFMRVDLYSCSNTIFFGELTPFPTSGRTRFHPPNVDFEIGKLWKL
ncbi:MAG: ATP-grasp fold amidoligase family protein [Cyanobacteria bacterium P01_A01_bin.123]